MPRFRSEQERDQRLQKQRVDQPSPSVISPTEASPSLISSAAGFPDYYRHVEIKYSRFGIEDFDFDFYNRTQYGGLETHIANSYCNSLLQSMFFTVRLFAELLMEGTATPCDTMAHDTGLHQRVLFVLRARLPVSHARRCQRHELPGEQFPTLVCHDTTR
jgi:hypothetical protein